jgi:hypothetical protein
VNSADVHTAAKQSGFPRLLCARCAEQFESDESAAKHCSRACMTRMKKLRRKMRAADTFCPTPTKPGRYESLADAWLDALIRGISAYRCCCGFAHLTKKKHHAPEWVSQQRERSVAQSSTDHPSTQTYKQTGNS